MDPGFGQGQNGRFSSVNLRNLSRKRSLVKLFIDCRSGYRAARLLRVHLKARWSGEAAHERHGPPGGEAHLHPDHVPGDGQETSSGARLSAQEEGRVGQVDVQAVLWWCYQSSKIFHQGLSSVGIFIWRKEIGARCFVPMVQGYFLSNRIVLWPHYISCW